MKLFLQWLIHSNNGLRYICTHRYQVKKYISLTIFRFVYISNWSPPYITVTFCEQCQKVQSTWNTCIICCTQCQRQTLDKFQLPLTEFKFMIFDTKIWKILFNNLNYVSCYLPWFCAMVTKNMTEHKTVTIPSYLKDISTGLLHFISMYNIPLPKHILALVRFDVISYLTSFFCCYFRKLNLPTRKTYFAWRAYR